MAEPITSLTEYLQAIGYRRIPLESNPAKNLLLTASIHDKELCFIVDTGASHSCLHRGIAEALGIKTKDTDMQTIGIGSTQGMEVDELMVNLFHLADIELRFVQFAVLDLSNINEAIAVFGKKVDGIIGGDLLNKYQAIIDYKTQELFLKKQTST